MQQNQPAKLGFTTFSKSQRSKWFHKTAQTKMGPGYYHHDQSNHSQSPKWTISKQQKIPRFLPKQKLPLYIVSDSFNKNKEENKQKKGVTIPNAKRQYQLNELTSSLDYQPNDQSVKKKFPKFTFGYYQRTRYQNEVPAPNIYNTNNKNIKKVDFNKNQFFMKYEQRSSPYEGKQSNPGVGDYNINYNPKEIPHIKFPESKRPNYKNKSISSNTDYYQISGNLSNLAKGVSLTFRPNQKNADKFPAPNAYNPLHLPTNTNIINLNGKRSDLIQKEHKLHPGIGQYNLNIDELKKGVLIAKSKKPELQINDTPGPGSYDLLSTLQNSLGKIGKDEYKFKPFINPSPQQYEIKDEIARTRSPRCLNLYTNRTDFSKSITKNIGPGQYNIQKKEKAQNGTIGRSERKKQKINNNPSPNLYRPNYETFGKLPSYMTIHIKNKNGTSFMQKEENNPQSM